MEASQPAGTTRRSQPLSEMKTQPLARAQGGWAGLPMMLHRLPAREETSGGVLFVDPVLAIARSGRGMRWYGHGRRTQTLYSAPDMIELYGSGFEIERARWEGEPGEVIMVEFPAGMVRRLLQGDAPPLDLHTRHEVFDGALAELVYRLWDEAAGHSQHGALYAQGMTLALMGLLTQHHGSRPAIAQQRVGRLGPQQVGRLRDYIAEQLGEDLCVERLAALVAMSPHHFSKVFKASFGLSPHAFVLERRIEAAGRVLRAEPGRPLADIAAAHGFCSQAHFTEAFRSRLGTTPARWRREA